MRLSGNLSSCVLKTSSIGDSTTSLARLFQCMIVHTVKCFLYLDNIGSFEVQFDVTYILV